MSEADVRSGSPPDDPAEAGEAEAEEQERSAPPAGAEQSGAERAALEAERDFLLRSLADLETERDEGELTVDQYERLAGAYTARAAAILRILDGMPAVEAEAAGRRRGRRGRVGVAIVLVAVAALAAVLIPNAVGERGAGQTITGNAQSSGQPDVDALARAVAANPDDLQSRLVYARFLLDSGELVGAIEQFDAAVRLDPSNAEALAYSGWIIALAGISEPTAGTTDTGLERIDRAIAADPGYPDAHAFRGLVLLNTGDAAGAVAEFERYLDVAPDGPLRGDIDAALERARARAAARR